MATQTGVLKALREKEGPTKTADLAKELKTGENTIRALISKLKRKDFVDGDGKEGWYATDTGREAIEAGEEIPTTPKDVGKDELSKFRYFGQLAGADPDEIAAASELFKNVDPRSMAEVQRVLAEMSVPMATRTKWENLYRDHLRTTTPPERRDELYPLPEPSPAAAGAHGAAPNTASPSKEGGRDYIVEGVEIHWAGDGLGEFTFAQALQAVAVKRGTASKGAGDGELGGVLTAFAGALKNVNPNQPMTVKDLMDFVDKIKGGGDNHPPGGYIDGDGNWQALQPGQPVVIVKKESPPPATSGRTLVVRQTPQGITTEEVEAGSPIIIQAGPPATGSNPSPMMPFPVIDGGGKPVVDQNGHPVYANIQPMLEWLKFQGQERRADERHGALMGLAQTVRENFSEGIQALKVAAQEVKAQGKTGGTKSEGTKQETPAPQVYRCGQCRTEFQIPNVPFENIKCPNPQCDRTYTKAEIEVA